MDIVLGKGIYFILTIFAFLTPTTIAIWLSIKGKDREKEDFIRTNWRVVAPAIFLAGLVATGFFGREFIMYEYNIALAASKEMYEEYLSEHADDFNVLLEYGDNFKLPYDENMWTITDVGEEEVLKLDNMELGEKELTVEMVHNKFIEEFHLPHNFKYLVNVVDTQMPTISEGEDVVLQVGDEFNLLPLPEITANDPVDGDLEVKFEGVEVIRTDEPDVFDIVAVAEDFNGNKVETKFKVIVLGYTNEELAYMVYMGDFGNGVLRKLQLGDEGYSYDEVQALVNKIYYGWGYPVR